MKRKLNAIWLLLLLVPGLIGAQESTPEAANIGVDTAQQRLKEVSISKFEDPGFWAVTMPLDHGIASHRRFEGGPSDKDPLPEEEAAGITEEDQYVLGVKVEYLRRGSTSISVMPSRPLAVPGIAKTIQVWVVGRNFNHRLKVVIEDFFGNRATLDMGKLNFSGWKQLTVAVPPSVQQRSPYYNGVGGIKILGFVVEPALTETYGTYYVYFDDLRVTTDLFAEENRDPDDMVDNW
ncbi:flagellar filament outer layer protein FlaA [Spirochaeta lutea]|uniref:Flagellar filament protein FlaA n=1 Tax=Spirochaeta lutea TaxID=1480694 RepID=A0A098R494_9SPIO|nr:flagellar filament outer layer protein FlaA [Spirochaeta lutea]KGE73582.1 flagellar filament protein FlaA [Spirochaeta lutea]